MHSVTLLTLLLVASASASSLPQPQQQDQVAPSVSSVSTHQAGSQVVGNAPAVQPIQVEGPQPVSEHQHHHVQHQQPAYYSPAGMITVIGSEQQQGVNKPVVPTIRNFEQYGQPEPSSLPPNYKPFGSWGLYIGGNPADGYYTNYYKSLSNSVDKQQAGEPVKPVVSQTAALNPILRQAGSSPYVGNDFYSYAYSPSDLSSPVAQISPVQAGAQVYGAPAVFDQSYPGVSVYADSYATKRVGAAYAQKEMGQKEVTSPILTPPSKGYQSRVYVYPTNTVPLAAPVTVQNQQQSHQQHVVAYPVPVGSQIVGSQQGVDGAFNPYGVHAFTRYAVKPTVVSQDPAYYYSVPGTQQLPAYKQQVYSVPQTGASYYPLSFYGYPMSQLHYSQGSVVPSGHLEQHHGPAQPVPVESDKVVENEQDKLVNKQQKRA